MRSRRVAFPPPPPAVHASAFLRLAAPKQLALCDKLVDMTGAMPTAKRVKGAQGAGADGAAGEDAAPLLLGHVAGGSTALTAPGDNRAVVASEDDGDGGGGGGGGVRSVPGGTLGSGLLSALGAPSSVIVAASTVAVTASSPAAAASRGDVAQKSGDPLGLGEATGEFPDGGNTKALALSGTHQVALAYHKQGSLDRDERPTRLDFHSFGRAPNEIRASPSLRVMMMMMMMMIRASPSLRVMMMMMVMMMIRAFPSLRVARAAYPPPRSPCRVARAA